LAKRTETTKPRETRSKKYRQWHKLILALMNEPTIAAAARACDMSQATAETMMHDPEFAEQFRLAQKMALGQGLAAVEYSFNQSVSILRELSNDKTVSPAVRAAAAGKLIDIAIALNKQQANARYTKQLEDELSQVNAARIEEETGQAGAPERQRYLPPAGGLFGVDGDGGPAAGSDAEGDEGAEGDDQARRTNRRTSKSE
jgi:uncharacterized protein with ATP-grasp and redox domains